MTSRVDRGIRHALVYVIRCRMISRIASYILLSIALIYPDVVDHQVCGELEMHPILMLEAIRHSQVEDEILIHDEEGEDVSGLSLSFD